MSEAQSLAHYRLLGRSGLRVSPLALGTMSFGQADWGSEQEDSRRIFDAYLDRGGNFIDTADRYGEGRSEEQVGEFLGARRDKIVLATKYSLGAQPGNPNSGGNSRRNMVRSVEASLRRLRTDYIDLYYLHVWDQMTEPDEVMRGFEDLVRSGKVVYVGVSDTPAWQVSRMQTMADLRGWAPFVALQIEYSLLQRTVERDLVPMALEIGLGVTPWSPLGFGMLAGGYSRKDLEVSGTGEIGDQGAGRRRMMLEGGRLTERIVTIAEKLAEVAQEVGASSAQTAIAWLLTRPGVTSPILGARTVDQLVDTLGALDVKLEPRHLAALDEATRVEPGFPHDMINQPWLRAVLLGHSQVRPRR